MRDPMELFESSADTVSDTKPHKDYPGNTPPRNRGVARVLPPKGERIGLLDSQPYREYLVGGQSQKCYTIGALCAVLDRKAVTIRSWEAKGWLPKPRLRTAAPSTHLPGKSAKGRRLYSRSQIEYLVASFEASCLDDPRKADWDLFRHFLRQYPTN